MHRIMKKALGVFTASAIMFSSFASSSLSGVSAATTFSTSGGWFETAYAEWNGATADKVYYKKSSEKDSDYKQVDTELVRSVSGSKIRVDIPGLAGNVSYDIKVITKSGEELKTTVKTMAHDRSGYAHFKYSEGVGAYKNDGTPKDNAIVVYVTNQNKNTVTIPGFGPENGYSNAKGIGWILNNNPTLISAVTQKHPLIIRFIGTVNGSSKDRISGATELTGLTGYNSTENGGTKGDNGYMAIIKGAQNLTLEGIGYDAQMFGWGISFYHNTGLQGGKNYEVRNLTLKDYPEDGIGIQGELQIGFPIERVWIHNNSFYSGYAPNPTESDKAQGDGSCDFKRGQYYTLSYNYFEGAKKTNLIGASDSNQQYNITFHHNWWKNCASRLPLVRQTNIHIYNNYYQIEPGAAASQTIDARASAYVFSEANYFSTARRAFATTSNAKVKSYNDVLFASVPEGDYTRVANRDDKVSSSNKYANFDTNPDIFYYDSSAKKSNVTLLTDAVSAKARNIAYSGVMKQNVKAPSGPISLLSNPPSAAVKVPYSVTFDSKGLGSKISSDISSRTEVDNIVYVPSKKYAQSATGMTIKEQGVMFKLDSTTKVTVNAGSNSKYFLGLYDQYGKDYALVASSAKTSVDVPAGTYFIETSQADVVYKDSIILGLSFEKSNANIENPITPPSEEPTTPVEEEKPTTPVEEEKPTTPVEEEKPTTPVEEEKPTTPVEEEKPATSEVSHNFTKNGKTSSTFAITGNLSTGYGKVSYNSLSLSQCLKMESSTSVKFDSASKGTLTLVFRSADAGKNVKVDGKSYTIDSKGIATIELSAGSHTITKGDSVYLFYIGLSGAGSTAPVEEEKPTTPVEEEKPTTPVEEEKPTTPVEEEKPATPETKGTSHNFTKDGKTSSFFSITGNLSTGYGKVSYDGLSLSQCLKVESSTKITFKASSSSTLTLVFRSSDAGKSINVDGTKYKIDSKGIATISLKSGSHTITKADSVYMFFMNLA